ncbi:MAG: hypothetical protein CVU54_02095 [Deltaproteobacteria bacterium HGW-Deltaproteobacteria-12]|jgi:hypothetical protein|nr:MAG: hypothetical protein CVU54_02095 [Deltaproteobacteria bacterium HGW-Deltaproteobacteria-12]
MHGIICAGCCLPAVFNIPKDKQIKIPVLPGFIDMIHTGDVYFIHGGLRLESKGCAFIPAHPRTGNLEENTGFQVVIRDHTPLKHKTVFLMLPPHRKFLIK